MTPGIDSIRRADLAVDLLDRPAPGFTQGERVTQTLTRLNPFIAPEFLAEQIERAKASVRAKVEHPFRVVKQQLGYAKVRYRGLAKNTARLTMLFALSNLWMARRQVLGAQA